MERKCVLVRVAENGRVGLPAWQRKLVGLEHGGLVQLEVANGELRLRPIDKIIDQLQERLAPYAEGPVGGVEMLFEERRREVALEEQEEKERGGE